MLPDPIFWNVHMYGVMIAVGVLCCFVMLFVYSKMLRVNEKFIDFVYYNAIVAIALGFGAATLFQSFYNYLENPEADGSPARGRRFGSEHRDRHSDLRNGISFHRKGRRR